jgi:hypothetical protein
MFPTSLMIFFFCSVLVGSLAKGYGVMTGWAETAMTLGIAVGARKGVE